MRKKMRKKKVELRNDNEENGSRSEKRRRERKTG